VPKGPQASHTDFCPPTPSYPSDCEEACGKFRIEFELPAGCRRKFPTGPNGQPFAYLYIHYDDCNEKLVGLPKVLVDGSVSDPIIPKCKCCGDQKELVCARPALWDDHFATFLAHDENAEESYQRNLTLVIDRDWDGHSRPQPSDVVECCKDNGYYVDCDKSSNVVTVGCVN
jgi:hypothetical protein